jgi:hypothetical protein
MGVGDVPDFWAGDRIHLRAVADSVPLPSFYVGRVGRVIRRLEDGGYVVRGEDGEWGAYGIDGVELEAADG